jgi:hypothetical protein
MKLNHRHRKSLPMKANHRLRRNSSSQKISVLKLILVIWN